MTNPFGFNHVRESALFCMGFYLAVSCYYRSNQIGFRYGITTVKVFDDQIHSELISGSDVV